MLIGALALSLAACGSEQSDTKTVTVTDTSSDTRTVPAATAVDSAEETVRHYYRLLNSGDFDAAWSRLSPSVQDQFGGYDQWRDGYDLTEGTYLTRLKPIQSSPTRVSFSVGLKAKDIDACNDTINQTFDGTWALRRSDGQWTVTDISFDKVSGGDVTRYVSDCPLPTDDYVVDPPSDYEYPDDYEPDYESSYSDFCDAHDCIPNFDNGNGYLVQCEDGSWSHSGGIQGACSWHGGVR